MTARMLGRPAFDRLRRRMTKGRLFQRVVDNTLWQLVDKVLRLLLGLVVGIWVARYLGPGDFGLLNYAIAFVALFTAIADGGMQTVIVRELVRRPLDRSTIVRSAIALRATGALIAIVLAALLIAVLQPTDLDTRLMVLIVSASLLPQAWDVIDFEHQSRLLSRPIVITRAASFMVFSAIKVLLIAVRWPVTWFAVTVAAEAALSAVIMRLLPGARRSLAAAKSSLTEIKYLLHTCWPLTIASLSVMLYMRIDQVMLGQMLGDRAVGTFSAAVRVSESWYFIPVAVMSSIAPALLVTLEESEARYRQKLLSVVRVLGWLAVAVALAVSLGATRIIAVLYGPNYAPAASVLVIHAWSGVFVSLGIAAGPWFVNGGMLTFKMAQSVAGAVINITMNVILIPRFGAVGAAWSTLISYAVSAFFCNALSRKTRPIFMLQAKAMFTL